LHIKRGYEIPNRQSIKQFTCGAIQQIKLFPVEINDSGLGALLAAALDAPRPLAIRVAAGAALVGDRSASPCTAARRFLLCDSRPVQLKLEKEA
jgi:hypothetical protein